MKRLWTSIPPFLSDVQGFQLVINETDGVGIVDDPSRYKNVPKAGTAGGGFGGGRRGGFGGRPDGGFGGHGGFGGRGSGRVFQSDLRNEDIISGTEQKLIQAFEQNGAPQDPSFALLCNAPSSAMISSDLESAALKISETGNIPAGSVKIYGEKDYLFGISKTLEALGKLLLEEMPVPEKIPGTVNILGANTIDWCDEASESLKNLLESCGYKVICSFGGHGMTKEKMEASASASLNVVVNVSGMKLAAFMEEKFEIPYIAGAPFGKIQEAEFVSLLKQYKKGELSDSCRLFLDRDKNPDSFDAIVMGEQLTANAVRRVLKENGFSNVCVLSFFEMEKSLMEPGDKKISSEDELKEWAASDSLRLIVADPDYKIAAERPDVTWKDMPNSGMSIVNPVPPVDFSGSRLDDWIFG